MNFGSGFRLELHNATNTGAYESMRRCVYNLWRAGALGLAVPSDEKIIECLGANVPLLVAHIRNSLTECADVVRSAGDSSLSAWVLRRAKELKGNSQTGKLSAVAFSEALFSSFQPLRDVAIYKQRTVTLGKKAQLLCADLHRQLGVCATVLSQTDSIITTIIFHGS